MKRTCLLLFLAILAFTACKKNNSTPSATGTLQDESGSCLPGTVHGAWYSGVQPDKDSNYVEVSVNVTLPGTYKISTDRQKGVLFSDSGTFSNTGLQMVRLKPNGIFTSGGSANFTTSFSGSTCGFSIPVKESTGGVSVPLDSWTYTSNGKVFSGQASAYYSYIAPVPGSIFINGSVAGSSYGDSTISIIATMPGANIVTGTYPTYIDGNYFSSFSGQASEYTGKMNNIDIVITNVTITGNGAFTSVMGTFSGSLSDLNGGSVPITNGAFYVLF